MLARNAMRVFVAVWLAVVFCALPVRAELSDFERETVDRVLGARSVSLDASPEGKVIESVEIVTGEVFDERDPVPNFANLFHTTTRAHVVRRELLFRPGDRYAQARIDESARHLRASPQLSLVLLVAAQGSAPDRVRVWVITRDTWSLRLNTYFELSSEGLVKLYVQPSETNLAGRHAIISGLYTLLPDTYSVGGALAIPRVDGSHVRSSLSGNVIANRETGSAEGTFGHLRHGQPLYSLDARWAWGVYVAWREDVARSYIGTVQRTYDARATPALDDEIPFAFDRRILFGEYEIMRSFGRQLKLDLSTGVEARLQRYQVGDLSAYAPRAVDEYVAREVPLSDRRLGPFVQLRVHASDFERSLDIDTLGLQEDYRLGPEFVLRLLPALEDWGSSWNRLATFAAASYTAKLGDGLARTIASITSEVAAEGRSDVLLEGATHLVSPRLPFGRLLYGARVAHRYRDYYNYRFELGGAGRLRGYAPGEFRGRDAVSSNLEFRTRSLQILSAQVGGAAFYDVGDAFDGRADFRPHQGVGWGLRILFPQVERTAFRLDWGVPLDGRPVTAADVALRGWYATFGQAFPVPAVRRSGAADRLPSSERESGVDLTYAGESF